MAPDMGLGADRNPPKRLSMDLIIRSSLVDRCSSSVPLPALVGFA